MKKRFLLLFIIGVSIATQAQISNSSQGGYGYFFTGPAYLNNATINDHLQSFSVLGNDGQFNSVAMMFGGEGFGMKGRFLIGGGGYGIGPFTSSSSKGKAEMFGGGGYFKFGYVIAPGRNTFLSTNLGVGYAGYEMKITNNNSVDPIYFNPAKPATPGDIRRYSFGGSIFDPSISIQTMAFGSDDDEGRGGFMLGIDFGCNLMVPIGGWYSQSDLVVGNIPVPGFMYIPYVKINIGGGGIEW
ncbi:MAG: hypothetical protein IPG60_12860 [Bacteroidetes bacterium]|nr:hypothetical protein [Bacteroidota bacterium]MBP7399569.1 hypothetical protein [Chitinophagales bacterium]MBK7109834.1 hypothetical protein [Bacteroidota bacterium]MBK8487429.1 hypothetical protein [Bacteroidota bacterium]MBK8682827.1 hypothetical protein [Bacteroidota bacterium]